MNYKTLFFFLFIIAVFPSVSAQDKLLLTNGKIRDLKGVVIHFDHDDVLSQNTRQKEDMEIFKLRKEEKEIQNQNSENWKEKQKKKIAKSLDTQEKIHKKTEKRRVDFEEDVKEKMGRLSPADFEKWKNKKLVQIQTAETKRLLAQKLDENLAAAKKNKENLRELRRFSKRISRDLVFSILKADSTEIVVYNADTLGYLSDGEADLEYGVSEMRAYIKGRQDGRKHSLHDLGTGAGVGLVFGLLNTWFLDAFYAPIFPAVGIGIMTIVPLKTKPDNEFLATLNELGTQAYMDGYRRSARGRKIMAFTLGSVAGLGVGISAGLLSAPSLRGN